jgi:hypothetical protein
MAVKAQSQSRDLNLMDLFILDVAKSFAKVLQDPSLGKPGSSEAVHSQEGGGSEEDRFRAHWRGKTSSFRVESYAGNGSFISDFYATSLIVQDSSSGKRFRVGYEFGIGKGLIDSGSLVGSTVIIEFNSSGAPRTIKNTSNGRTMAVSNWKASGYGW